MLSMNTWYHAWMVLVIALLGGIIVAKLTERPRIPDVAGYLILGIALGPWVFHAIHEPSVSQVSQFIVNLGATVILFDGGRAVSFETLKQASVSIALLATLGVLVTAAVVALVAHQLFHVPWLVSLLLAATIASTDPATLIPVFKRVPIAPRLQETAESESAFNDAIASVLVVALLAYIGQGASMSLWVPVGLFVQSAVFGLIIGLCGGLAALWLVSIEGWGVLREYASLVFLALAMSAYVLADVVHGSGFMAAFVAGIVVGNGAAIGWPIDGHTSHNVNHFGNAITAVLRILIFVLLGTQVDFSIVGRYFLVGIVVVLCLMFIARPLSVLASVLPDRHMRWSWREIVFLFWVRETGVIPAALSGLLAARHVPGATMISAIVFLAILFTILIQATTTGWLAGRLGLLRTAEDDDI